MSEGPHIPWPQYEPTQTPEQQTAAGAPVHEEYRTALDGIKEFILRTRMAWRDETLHGTTGQTEILQYTLPFRSKIHEVGDLLDRKPRPGLKEKDAVIRSMGKAVHKDKAPEHQPRLRRHKALRAIREYRSVNARKKEARAHDLRQTYGEDIAMTKRERREHGTRETPGTFLERKRRRKAGRQHRGLVNEVTYTRPTSTRRQRRIHDKAGPERTAHESRGRIATYGRKRMKKTAKPGINNYGVVVADQTLSGRRRSSRILRLERRQEKAQQKLKATLDKPEKPEAVKRAEKEAKRAKKAQRKEQRRLSKLPPPPTQP